MTAPLSGKELYASLQSVQDQEASLIDSLNLEFFKALWNVVSHVLEVLEVYPGLCLAKGRSPVRCKWNCTVPRVHVIPPPHSSSDQPNPEARNP